MPLDVYADCRSECHSLHFKTTVGRSALPSEVQLSDTRRQKINASFYVAMEKRARLEPFEIEKTVKLNQFIEEVCCGSGLSKSTKFGFPRYRCSAVL